MLIHEIKGKMNVTWNNDVKSIIDTWESYFISLEDFRDAVLVKGLTHAKANGCIAWIVDSSKANGAFSPEIQKFIETDIFPSFAKNGIKYFITITSQVSAVTRLNVSKYASKTGPNGLQLVEVQSVDDAIEWLKLQSK